MTRQELIDDIKRLGFTSETHAAMMTLRGKAVKGKDGSYTWEDSALMALTIPDLEMLRKQINQSRTRVSWK